MRIAVGITLVMGLMLFSCNKPPEACITVDNSSVAVGGTATLNSSCSKRALSYIWTFEAPVGSTLNGVERSEEEITVGFDLPGSYVVTLNAYQKYSWNGQMASTTTTITVN